MLTTLARPPLVSLTLVRRAYAFASAAVVVVALLIEFLVPGHRSFGNIAALVWISVAGTVFRDEHGASRLAYYLSALGAVPGVVLTVWVLARGPIDALTLLTLQPRTTPSQLIGLTIGTAWSVVGVVLFARARDATPNEDAIAAMAL